MSHTIPFTEETFKPLCVKGNDTAENPVEFELCAVGGAAKARLKSMIIATSGLADLGEWSEAVQRSVIAAFETGAGVFAEGVTAVRGLKVPAALALKIGLIAEIPKGLDRKSEVAVLTGLEFSRVCGYWPILSFEVAMAIARISGQADIDPRFFGWLSTSLVKPATPGGTAARAEGIPGGNGTAASPTPRGSRRRTT
jgi:hypothetical protein